MARHRFTWRGRRRRRFPRWRRYRRYWRPFHHWRRRRRFHHRHGTASVRYWRSSRNKTIVVRGWEPLGNICPGSDASKEATPWEVLDKDYEDTKTKGKESDCAKSCWSGTFGGHFFTFKLLLQRAKIRLCQFSSDWNGWDYLEFKGGYIWLPRLAGLQWMFNKDHSIKNPTETKEGQELAAAKSWTHPGVWLNRRGPIIMHDPNLFPSHRGFRRLKVKPPTGWEGHYSLPAVMNYIFFQWFWTALDMQHAMYDYWCVKQNPTAEHTKICCQVPWWAAQIDDTWRPKYADDDPAKTCGGDVRELWTDRENYLQSKCNTNQARTDQNNIPANTQNWGPFLPQSFVRPGEAGFSLWFKYKFYFQLSGDSVYRQQPHTDPKVVIPRAPKAKNTLTGEVQPGPERPQDPWDILPGDLDRHGILKERAYRRITSTGPGDEPAKVGPSRVRFRSDPSVRRKRLRHILSRLLE
ncbi:ORF1 [Seal anellovirus 2]|uniref:Capsid protein n=1 Tax=Seal anellovirus 2 TaxID=1427157 RepID=V5NEQ1_9VIRU|nr:ORF1 [Seal anellovirus 2]AHA86839.1 ORF1 [Seal anellovirus 2]